MIHIGIVGTGPRAADHARRCENLDGVSVAGVAASGDDTGGGTIEASHSGIEEMINETEPDGVDVCLTPGERADALGTVAGRGVPVCCSGPLAGELGDATAAVEAIETAGVVGVAGYRTAYAPPYETALSQVRDGEIGAVGNVRASRTGARADESIVQLVGREVEFFRRACGEVKRVFARRTTAAGEDAILATLRLENDVVGHVEGRVGSFAADDQTERFELSGTAGLLEYDADGVSPVRLRGGGTDERTAPLAADACDNLLAHFQQCLAGDTDPRITPAHARETVRVCEALHRSADRGTPIAPAEVRT
jgi:predicted dehydrogenase